MILLKDYALTFVGLNYKWGGDDPLGGYDCSGLVIELIQSVGLLPHDFDTNAQGLYNHFEAKGVQNSYAVGSLCFYGKAVNKITHVAMLLENTPPFRIIEAGGGGSNTNTKTDAEEQNAFVRLRPMKHRQDLVAIIKPFYFQNFR